MIYFLGLAAVYVVGILALRPTPENGNSQNWALVVMPAPTVGALLARFLGPGVIQWGRPSWALLVCLVAGLLPIAFGLAGYRIAASLGLISADDAAVSAALAGVVAGAAAGVAAGVAAAAGAAGIMVAVTILSRLGKLRSRYGCP